MQDSYMWRVKGATLSDKNAKKEYGLTKEQLYQALQEGKLQYRKGNMHGNPWYRLLRHEVEDLTREIFGADYLEDQKKRIELAQVSKELRSITKKKKELEERKAEIMSLLDNKEG